MQVSKCGSVSITSKQATPTKNIAFSGKEELRAELAQARRKFVIAKAKDIRWLKLAAQYADQEGISLLGAIPFLAGKKTVTAAAAFRCATLKLALTLSPK